MVLGDFMPGVRVLVRDNDSALYHNTDEEVLHALVDAVEHLRAVRPSARYIQGVLNDIAWPADVETLKAVDPCVPMRWVLGVKYFAAGRLFEADTTDTVNMQLAAGMSQKADIEFQR